MAYRLYKRGSNWWARINGERRSTKQTSREAAEAVAREWERRAADPAYAAADQAGLEAAVKRLISDLGRRGRAAATIGLVTQKAGHLVRLLPPTLAGIDAKAVDAYLAAREAEGAHPHTVAKELSALRQTLSLAARRGEYPRDVKSVMPIGFSSRYEPRKRWLPPAEVEALLVELEPFRARHVAFLIATGSRLGESLRAQAEDVDLARWTVRLRGTKTEASKRVVPIAEPFRGLLRRAMESAPKSGLLFDRWGMVNRDIASACRRADIARAGPNDFRRTHGTWLRNAGVEPHLIAPVLGHTSTKMVEQVYGRIDPTELGARIAERVSSVYRAPGGACAPGDPGEAQTPGEVERPVGLGPTTCGLEGRVTTRAETLKTCALLAPLASVVPPLYRAVTGLAALRATDPDAYALALDATNEEEDP